MGTFGAGPFDSDGAHDLLDDLGGRPPEQRTDALADLLNRLIADPEILGREVFADEVVAAVAVIASRLPQVLADEPWWRDVINTAAPAAPTTDLVHLTTLATAALPMVIKSWNRDWTSPADAAAAHETVTRLVSVLRTGE